MSDLFKRGFNTVTEAFLDNGQLVTSDVPPEVLSFLRTAMSASPDAETLGDINFPFPIPEFLEVVEVRPGGVLRYSDNIYIQIPEQDFDAGNIPEVEYSDSPFLDVGPMSTRRYERLKEEMGKLYGSDQTSGVPMSMNLPEDDGDPFGGDRTAPMRPVTDE